MRRYNWESFPNNTLLQWFQTLAWKRRAEDPLILVRTSASGADAGRHPEVTATPRSVWEARGGATFEAGLR